MGTIKYIAKTITETAGSIKLHATNGNIEFNAAKDIILDSRDKIRYDKYEPLTDPEDKEFDIAFSLNKDESTVVPLGILDFNNEYENPYFAFNYSLSLNNIEALEFQIKDADGNVIYQITNLEPVVITAAKTPQIKNEIKGLLPAYPIKTIDFRSILEQYNLSPADYTKIGSYVIYWDGFDSNELYDSTRFNNKKLTAKITAIKAGKRKSLKVEFATRYEKVDWVDVKIDRKKKRIDTILRVNLQDGGAKGLDCYNEPVTRTTNDPPQKFCPWDKIPKSEITPTKPIIKTRTKTFAELEKLAIEGINYYWSKVENSELNINNQNYKMCTRAINTKDNSLNTLNLIFNTNKTWGRSGNPGVFGKVYYNIGYCNFLNPHQSSEVNRWGYLDLIKDKVDEDFMYTCAHELGHSILKAYGNIWYSFTHDDSSEIWQTPNGKKSYQKEKDSNEINLMHYFKDDPHQSEYDYKLIKASKEDILGLIWLTKIKISNS